MPLSSEQLEIKARIEKSVSLGAHEISDFTEKLKQQCAKNGAEPPVALATVAGYVIGLYANIYADSSPDLRLVLDEVFKATEKLVTRSVDEARKEFEQENGQSPITKEET